MRPCALFHLSEFIPTLLARAVSSRGRCVSSHRRTGLELLDTERYHPFPGKVTLLSPSAGHAGLAALCRGKCLKMTAAKGCGCGGDRGSAVAEGCEGWWTSKVEVRWKADVHKNRSHGRPSIPRSPTGDGSHSPERWWVGCFIFDFFPQIVSFRPDSHYFIFLMKFGACLVPVLKPIL